MKISKYVSFMVMLWTYCVAAQVNFVNIASELNSDSTSGTTYLGNGISFCDYNSDGFDDITIATESGRPIKFYKNVNGVFVQENLQGIDNVKQHKQICWVDYDNDGDKDLFVTSDSFGNNLYMNLGDSSFIDVTMISGLPTERIETYGASWGDYNNDSFLDVFLSNRSETDEQQNYFYENNGDGTFTNVTDAAGFDDESHMSFCSAFFDFNNDGLQDIYISSDKYINQNFLYKNNGDETFTDVSESSGTGVLIDAMSTTIGDYNNDGWFDIYVTNTPIGGNAFFRNNGDNTFSNITEVTGTDFHSFAWGAVFLDADNDMDQDMYVSSSMDGSIPTLLSAQFYTNDGDGTFSTPNSGFVDDTGISHSNAIGDVDNDGYPEIIVNNSNNENIFLWKNLAEHNNNWLKVNLEGVISNRDGIGSRIEISINGEKQYRYTLCGEGYISQNSNSEFFGLGTNVQVDYIKVTWLSGVIDYIENVTANQILNILEGSYPLSVTEEVFQNDFIVFPIPTEDLLEFNSKSKVSTIQIFNQFGSRVYASKPNTSEGVVNIGHLSSGVYILKVQLGNTLVSKKIIKN